MEDILVPIFVCVVLPVAIVLIVYLAAMNSDNKRAQILIKAIEAGNGIDTDKLADALQKPRRSDREILNLRLLRGCIFGFVGLGIIIVDLLSQINRGSISDMIVIIYFLGVSCVSIGISYLIVYFVSRKEITGNK